MPEFEKMDESQPEEKICNYLSLLWSFARDKENRLRYVKGVLEIQEQFPTLDKADEEKHREQIARLETELQSILGEIALVSCPVENCPTHTFQKD
ncbi:hypothetical protein TNCT_665981 [Trichonephila clavata]|uniref:Uncharacterized protein n=1 Tax=Trichonephila clavata TaxID=2740835 RepID=A0A8X6F3W3_TRICU|nr:hypothetical protein TNCT_665981 [Trichonephila clavata]